jgi:hypothetical protein
MGTSHHIELPMSDSGAYLAREHYALCRRHDCRGAASVLQRQEFCMISCENMETDPPFALCSVQNVSPGTLRLLMNKSAVGAIIRVLLYGTS